MFGYIYKFTMIPTGKIYIGKRECQSFDEHYWGSGKLWKVDLEKYGKNSVLREVLDWAESREELKEKEVYWISIFNSQDSSIGYNIHNGGSGGNMVGNTELWSEMHSGEKNGRYGKPVSQDTCDKIGFKNKGKKRSEECKNRISKSLKNKKKPDGFGDKISKRLKGRHNTWTKGYRVVCVETGEVFNSLAKAAEKYNTSGTSINRACKDSYRIAGKHHWRYMTGED